MKEPLIRMKGVSFDYTLNDKEVVPVLRDISLDIYPGEYVAIIGHNGSGKSTLAKHFNGILKPKEGNVYVDGKGCPLHTGDPAKGGDGLPASGQSDCGDHRGG